MRTLCVHLTKLVGVVRGLVVNLITMPLCAALAVVGAIGGWHAANHHGSFAYARDLALIPAVILMIGLIDQMLEGDGPDLLAVMCAGCCVMAGAGNFTGGFRGFESRWAWLTLAVASLIWGVLIQSSGFLSGRSQVGAFVDTLFYAAAVTAFSAAFTYGSGWAVYACLIAAGATFIIKLMVDGSKLGFHAATAH